MKVLVFILLTLTPLHKGLASSFSNQNTVVRSTLQRKLFVIWHDQLKLEVSGKIKLHFIW